jgi:hypothetical protein
VFWYWWVFLILGGSRRLMFWYWGCTKGCLDTVGYLEWTRSSDTGVCTRCSDTGGYTWRSDTGGCTWCSNTGFCTSFLILLGTAGVLVPVGLSVTSGVPM